MQIPNPPIKSIKDIKSHEIYLEFIEPKNEINDMQGKAFETLTFNEVSVLKRVIVKDLQTALDIFFDGLKLEDCRIIDFYQWQKYVVEELNVRTKREAQLEITDPRLKQAGAERLNIFGELNTKIALAEQFGTTPQKVGGWNYDFVVNILLFNKVRAEINLIKQ